MVEFPVYREQIIVSTASFPALKTKELSGLLFICICSIQIHVLFQSILFEHLSINDGSISGLLKNHTALIQNPMNVYYINSSVLLVYAF